MASPRTDDTPRVNRVDDFDLSESALEPPGIACPICREAPCKSGCVQKRVDRMGPGAEPEFDK